MSCFPLLHVGGTFCFVPRRPVILEALLGAEPGLLANAALLHRSRPWRGLAVALPAATAVDLSKAQLQRFAKVGVSWLFESESASVETSLELGQARPEARRIGSGEEMLPEAQRRGQEKYHHGEHVLHQPDTSEAADE